MEATVVSIGKSVLVGALGYARSKAAEEVALQLGVEGDVAFIADELEMMQSFLMTADEERGQRKVLVTWVKHVRDLAYNVEDNLMDFSLLAEKSKSWWRSIRTVGERRRIAKEIKQLRAKVEDVSNRNLRYRLIDESSGSKPTVAEEQASIATAAIFGINEARLAAFEHEKSSKVDLHQLITDNSVDLKVVAVWGTSGDLGKMSAIQEVYDDPKVLKRFGFRAWVRLMHPFNPKEFLRNLVWQFHENSPDSLGKGEEGTSIGGNVLLKMENMEQNELVHVFNTQVSCNSYLIVIDDLSTIVEWHCIKKYFLDNKKQSRIVVSTQQIEIASLCTEKPYQVSELKQLSSDQTLYLFHKKNSVERVSMASASLVLCNIKEARFSPVEKVKSEALHASCSAEAISDSKNVTKKNTAVTTSEIQEEDQEPINAGEDQVCNSTARKNFDRRRTLPVVEEVLVRQESEKSTVVELVGQADNSQDCKTSEDQTSMASATAAVFETSKARLSAMMEVEKLKTSDEYVSMASASASVFDINEARLAAMEREKLKAMHASCSVKPIPDSYKVDDEEEYQQPENGDEDRVCNSTPGRKFDRSRTLALDDEVLVGRETEKSIVIRLVGQPDNNQGCKVISIWGMGGLGKTTLARSVYQCQQLGGWKHAWATALRPFNPEILLRNLASQLQKSIQEDPAGAISTGGQKKSIAVMKLEELEKELARLLNMQKCFVVLDDISSTSEWDLVKGSLRNAGRVIVTTRDKNIAIHCSRDYNNMYSLEGLKDDAALDLFIKKVFKDKTEKNDLDPAMTKQARLILKKCNGLPLAISTIGGFLATKPKTVIEWRKLNDSVSAELEINPELRTIKTILMRSYDGLPYHLKCAFLYLSIFPEDHKIRWNRLVRRWIAEGYIRDMHGMTAEELGRRYFDELLDRSMILQGESVNHYSGKIRSCQLHDIIREICISKAREENLVFTLEDGCCLNSTQGPIRHLVVASNWKRDKDVLMSTLDLSHVRSLTVFGEWRPFLISESMRFLRVLDLEDTIGLKDHHLDQIGQLFHLKYLSLRRCGNIYSLPDSLGNLRQLLVLDVRGTYIFEFPSTITKLRKLQHFHSTGRETVGRRGNDYSCYIADFFTRIGSCGILISTGPLLLRPQILDDDLNRSDIVNLHRFAMAHVSDYRFGLCTPLFKTHGVQIRRGIGKLKALQTLRHINIVKGKGKFALKELKELTELHKLGVVGVTIKNSTEFWSAIAGLNKLRSLSVEAHTLFGELDGCLGEGLSPPSCLQSLKLTGVLVRMTAWIHQLQNLSKLTLKYSRLRQDDSIQALGVLPNLAVLRLNSYSFNGRQLHFQNSYFRSLVVLELSELPNLESVLFEEDAMPRLELLQVAAWRLLKEIPLKEISGLPVLTSLREIRLGDASDELKEEVQRQVAEHLKHVRLNISI